MNGTTIKMIRWFAGAVILTAVVARILLKPIPFLFYHDLPLIGVFGRGLYVIVLAALLCLYRVLRGPTAADRIVATDILGILIVGLCALLTITTGRSWYMDIGIAWALQSFITTLALSKFLEGRPFDE